MQHKGMHCTTPHTYRVVQCPTYTPTSTDVLHLMGPFQLVKSCLSVPDNALNYFFKVVFFLFFDLFLELLLIISPFVLSCNIIVSPKFSVFVGGGSWVLLLFC